MKFIRMKKQKVKSQMKGQDRSPQKKQLNEGETGNLQEKRIQNNDSEDDPGSRENNGEDAKLVYQKSTRTKEQKKKQMSKTLEGIHSRITEAEQINDLGDSGNYCHRTEY